MYAIFTMFYKKLRYFFYIFKLNNLYIILGLLTLYHKHDDVLFVFTFLLLKTKFYKTN